MASVNLISAEVDIDTTTEKILPAWAYQEDTFDLFSRNVGPAVPWQRRSAIFMLATEVGIFGIIAAINVCPDEPGAPQYPMVIWVAACPCLIFRLATEIFALSTYLSWYVREVFKARQIRPDLECFQVMGIRTTFIVWLAMSLIFSMANGTGAITETLFTATYWKALSCPTSDNIIFSSDKMGLPKRSFGTIIVLVWVTGQLRFLVPLAKTIPSSSVDYIRGSSGHVVSRWSGREICHGFVFDELSEANGSATLQSLTANGNFASIAASGQWQFPLRHSLYTGQDYSATMANRVWLLYVARNAVRLILQIYLFFFFASGVHTTEGSYQGLFSIGLNFGLGSLKLLDAVGFMKFCKEIEKQVQVMNYPEEEQTEVPDQVDIYSMHLLRFRRNSKIACAGFAVLAAFFLFGMLWILGALF